MTLLSIFSVVFITMLMVKNYRVNKIISTNSSKCTEKFYLTVYYITPMLKTVTFFLNGMQVTFTTFQSNIRFYFSCLVNIKSVLPEAPSVPRSSIGKSTKS